MVTILLVEDNEIFRKTLKDALLEHFPAVQIEEASEGDRALELVRERHPQLIFMDINLPGENGLELTRKIKRIDPEAKVVILTAYLESEYLEAATEAGAVCFMFKGLLTTDEIVGLLQELDIVQPRKQR